MQLGAMTESTILVEHAVCGAGLIQNCGNVAPFNRVLASYLSQLLIMSTPAVRQSHDIKFLYLVARSSIIACSTRYALYH